jgi:hypothetical protein
LQKKTFSIEISENNAHTLPFHVTWSVKRHFFLDWDFFDLKLRSRMHPRVPFCSRIAKNDFFAKSFEVARENTRNFQIFKKKF